MMWYCSSRKRQGGQVLPIAAAAFLVMCALAGLAIDTSRDYLVKRQAQNAADFAVLAASKQMTLSGNLGSPISSNSNTVKAAHDYVANNGFSTIYSTGCDSSSSSSFTTTWFDVSGLPCGATAGFNSKVTVNSPPVALPGSPVPHSLPGRRRVLLRPGGDHGPHRRALHVSARHPQRVRHRRRERPGGPSGLILRRTSAQRGDPLPAHERPGRLRQGDSTVLRRDQACLANAAVVHRRHQQLPDVLGETGHRAQDLRL